VTSFSISPLAAPRQRPYISVEICHRYWNTVTPLPWGDMHLPSGWHLSPYLVVVPPIHASSRACLLEINRRRAQLPSDLLRDTRYAVGEPNYLRTSSATPGTPSAHLSGTHGSWMSMTCDGKLSLLLVLPSRHRCMLILFATRARAFAAPTTTASSRRR
jgi:hypothetical protein